MIARFPDSDELCRPFSIGSGPSECGARIGGRAPQGVASHLTYFATTSQDVSIFLNWQSFIKMTPCKNSTVPAGSDVEVVFHEARPRASSDTSTNEFLSEQPLVFKDVVPDEIVADNGGRGSYSGHKLGGKPYLIQRRQSLVDELRMLSESGWRHFLQFEYRAFGDAPWSGEPFADGLFHLFRHGTFDAKWRWLWQY